MAADLLWEGTMWPLCCLSPLCCSVTTFKISKQRIDTTSGCCGSSEDTLDLRRITDLSYDACVPCCCCRGTVTISAGDNSNPTTKITTWNTKPVYELLRDAWSNAKANVAVDVGGE